MPASDLSLQVAIYADIPPQRFFGFFLYPEVTESTPTPTAPPPILFFCAQPLFPPGPSVSDTHGPQPDLVSVKAQTGMHKWRL